MASAKRQRFLLQQQLEAARLELMQQRADLEVLGSTAALLRSQVLHDQQQMAKLQQQEVSAGRQLSEARRAAAEVEFEVQTLHNSKSQVAPVHGVLQWHQMLLDQASPLSP